jgi:peptidoglycan/LPS O-acetylase OafA/YrhL
MAIRLALINPRNGNPTAALVGNTLLFLLFARMVLHDHRLPGKPWMVTLFKMTYPLFLIHQNMGYVILSKLGGVMPKYLSLLFVVATMLFAAYVLATQIEKRVSPVVKRGADRLLSLAGEPLPTLQARHLPVPDMASAQRQASSEIAGQAAMQTSPETSR